MTATNDAQFQNLPIDGDVSPGWDAVAQAFRNNFVVRGEVGAALCILHRGKVVVDIAGGWTGPERTHPFTRQALALVFSTTKGMTALAAHVLVDRGLLDLHAPVRKYWPEYAANGKDDTTVAMLLNHSAGVPGFREPLLSEGYLDAEYMAQRIAAEPPFWEPGTRHGYHALNFGWMIGELVQRVTGVSLGRFFRDEIAAPLGADFWIGLPAEQEYRVAALEPPPLPVPGEPLPDVFINMMSHPNSTSALALTNGADFSPAAVSSDGSGLMMNSRRAHAAEIGAAGGIASAKGIAQIYAALANGNLISHDHVTRMGQTSTRSMQDAVLLVPTGFALGFMKSMDNRHLPLGDVSSFILGEAAFGHAGMGGSFGFYDPQAELAVGYTMTRMSGGLLANPRSQALIDAAYLAAGYRTNAPGVWVR